MDLVELVVELEHPREGDVASRKSRFDELRRAIEPIIEAAGGEVVNGAWINSTLLVRLPAEAVDDVACAEGVQRVTPPHKIERDA